MRPDHRRCGARRTQVGKVLLALARACWSAGDAPAADAALGRLSGILDGLCDASSPGARGDGSEARGVAGSVLAVRNVAGPETHLASLAAAAPLPPADASPPAVLAARR